MDGTRPADRRLATAVLAALILAFVLAYGWLAVRRHLAFNSTGYDLAIHEQILWNTAHGRFFASSLEVDNSFADHFRPLLLALVPLYALYQSPLTLIGLQTLVLAAGAVPLYGLAQDRFQSRWPALLLAAVYLAYPATGFVARFDFHTEHVAIPAFIAAFYAMERRRWGWASIWLLLPLLSKETMGLSVAGVGLYAMLRHRQWRWGGAWLGLGAGTFALTTFWLIPTLRGEASDSLARYAWLGQSPWEMAAALVSRPGDVWGRLTGPAPLATLRQLLLPLAFLPLLGLPELLLAAPGLAINLLADHFCQPTIYCHYTTAVTPFLFIAAVTGWDRLRRRWPAPVASWGVAGLVLLLAAYSLRQDNPFGDVALLPSALAPVGNAAIVQQALATVPPGASVVTTNDYAPHLARRPALYVLGVPSQREAPLNPDVVFLNLYDQQYILCDQIQDYVSRLDLDAYGAVFRTGGVIVIQRGAGSNASFRDFILNWNNCAG